jgi:glycosyltransferase involved in cell wall biosynthesis
VKTTIIIPVYNVESNLSECLDSLLAQTYTDYELILVNDGSTDASLQICKHYAAKDRRIKVIDQSNKGPAAARNTGLESAKGDYVGFVDADDFVENRMYQDMVTIAEQLKADVVMCNFKVYSSKNNYELIKNDLPYGELMNSSQIKKYLLQPYYGGHKGIIPSLCNKLYRRSFLNTHNLKIDETRVRAEDYWFNFYALGLAKSVYAIDKSYYHYYNNKGSVMKSFRENQFDLFLKTREELIQNNKTFQFEIDRKAFDKEFVENTNEFILFAILHQKNELVDKTLRNEEFLKAYQNFTSDKWHTRLIKLALGYKQRWIAKLIYKVWSKKVKL